jgi:hypothetical protein
MNDLNALDEKRKSKMAIINSRENWRYRHGPEVKRHFSSSYSDLRYLIGQKPAQNVH